MAASKQASTYVNTLPQCSPASVGLAQARSNQDSSAAVSFHQRENPKDCTHQMWQVSYLCQWLHITYEK